MTPSILCAIQPIFDVELKLIAQELLFRDDESGEAHILDADKATSDVLLNAYTGISSGVSSRNYPTFVNITRKFILSGELPVTDGQPIVYKYSAKDGIDSGLLEALKTLAGDGFSFAVCGLSDWLSQSELLNHIRYVKLDISSLDRTQLEHQLKFLKSHNVAVVAEKIEHYEDFNGCKALGFDGFQGFFLSKPQVVKGRTLDAQTKVVLELVQELQNPDTSPEAIEQLMMHDAALSFKLLRILSTAAFAMPRKVESVKDAVIFLGLDHIRSWATMIAFSTLKVKTDLYFPNQLVRAKMCELLAQVNGLDNPRKFFMAGLFSLLDAMLDMDMEEILSHVPLDDDLVLALLHQTGDVGDILAAVIAYEQANWNSIEEQKIAEYAFRDAYLESLQWANEINGSIGN